MVRVAVALSARGHPSPDACRQTRGADPRSSHGQLKRGDGEVLRTLADARRFILEQSEYIQGRQAWQCALHLVLEAAGMLGRLKPQPAT